MLNDFRSRSSLRELALAGLVTVIGTAQADVPLNAQRNDGVMSFPNVRVEVATPKSAVPKQTKAPGAAGRLDPSATGLVAAIDPATGRLVQPTAEDMASLQPAVSAKAGSRRAASESAVQEIYPAQGGVGLVLDTSHDSFMVVRRGADGKLEEVCVPGEEEARKALTSSKAKATATSKGDLQ